MPLNELETRKEIIDLQLRQAGWEANTKTLRFSLGTRPQKGKFIAISEWPVGDLWADYALFYEHELVGIVEAKKFQKDIVSDLTQAKQYSILASEIHNAVLLGRWNQYKVPFMFSSNGRKYM
jgi:type I restriction enzyme R subunit